MAEDPGNGLSFGQDRCRLIARALLERSPHGSISAESRRRAVAAAFRREGLDVQLPYLRPGSQDRYVFYSRSPTADRRSKGLSAGATYSWRAAAAEQGLLAAAIAIGEALCGRAYWDRSRRRCSWIGRSNAGRVLAHGLIAPRTDALSWDLYGGLTGIALFLAELFAHTGTASFRQAALGAIKCAVEQLEHADSTGTPNGLSFYTGLTGAAYAAWQVGERTQAETSARGLVDMLLAGSSTAGGSEGEDFLGSAGAIPALLLLGRQPGWSGCHELAIALTERLCRSNTMARYGSQQQSESEPPLTGLAHGASGIALCLLESHARVGRAEFLAAGRMAFSYEDGVFDPEHGNWPDFRESPGSSKARFAMAWCHGAPGIALSRLRASQLDPSRSEHYLRHARSGLEATTRQLRSLPQSEGLDPTPCHGATGLIEALWIGARVLGEQGYGNAALHAAGELVEPSRVVAVEVV